MEHVLTRIIDSLHAHRVEYGDARFVERESQFIVVKNGTIETLTHSTDSGVGIRVLKNSAWGFSSSNHCEKHDVDLVIKDALAIAAASSKVHGEQVMLSPLERQEGRYATPYSLDPMNVSLEKKIALLLACDNIMRHEPTIQVSTSMLIFRKVKTHFVSTDGSSLNQEMVFSGSMLKVFAMDKGELQSRSYGNYRQAGYEFIDSLELINNAERIRDEAVMLLQAPLCPALTTTVILDAHQMVLQVHESCGHPTELDRVLGTEASYAGTSFLTLDKYKKFQYGSDIVSIVADATVPGGLGTCGWDDEGVPAQRIELIKNGVFVGYLSSRETAPRIKSSSTGAMRADGWNRIPLIRMTNINLEPGAWELDDMIADTDEGVFMTTNKSWSIDDKRLNFQFGCELARKIENGKLTLVYKNPTYCGITPQFWHNCDALGNKHSWQLFGVPNCGKGEPGQNAYVGHGTVPVRFRSVQIGIAN